MYIVSKAQKESVMRILKYMKDAQTEIACEVSADAPCLDEDCYLSIAYLWYVDDPKRVFKFFDNTFPDSLGGNEHTLLDKLVMGLEKNKQHLQDVEKRHLKAKKNHQYAPGALEVASDDVKMILEDYGDTNSLKGLGLTYGGAVCGNTQVD